MTGHHCTPPNSSAINETNKANAIVPAINRKKSRDLLKPVSTAKKLQKKRKRKKLVKNVKNKSQLETSTKMKLSVVQHQKFVLAASDAAKSTVRLSRTSTLLRNTT